MPGRVTACGGVTAWRRVTLTACGRVRQRGVRVWEKRCVEVENHFHMKVTAVSTQQRKNVHLQPWPALCYGFLTLLELVNITVHTDPSGRVLGHRQTDSNITVHTDPPGRVLGHRQTDRQYHYMGELGNYVH